MKNYKISIITVTKNSEKFLSQNILSVKSQKYKNFEHIIVDGNSTDNTAEEAEKRGAVVHNEPRKGYGRAYKTGFSLIDTDYVATIDGDTTFPADKIPHVLAFLINNNLDFVTCN